MHDTEPVEVPAFRVAGLSLRTTNAAERKPATAQIGPLWQRYSAEQVAAKLPREKSAVGSPVAVYTDYESDQHREFTLVLGEKIPADAAPPRGFSLVNVPHGHYLRFRFRGPMPQAVIDGWRTIWEYFEHQTEYTRAFTADFELYDPQHLDAVDIYIALR